MIQPSEWIPLVIGIGDAEPEYASLDEAQSVMAELLSLDNSINASVSAEAAALPADCVFRENVLANLEAEAPIRQWSRGFMRGHQWLEELWESYVPNELDEEFAAMSLTLGFLASPDIADAFRKETAPDRSLETLATTIQPVFPKALSEYAHLGRSIAAVFTEGAATEQAPRRHAKTGRNDPCPCGSGRKYKKCCGVSAQ